MKGNNLNYNYFIDELELWIEDNIHNPMTLDIVARKAGYSKWHLQRLFFEVKGVKLATYIRDKRLYLASMALGESHAIIEIALSHGFSSQAAFTRAFALKYKCSPGRYRAYLKRGIRYENTVSERVG